MHVIILQLAASLFTGMSVTSSTHTPDTLMAMVVGLATLIALLKTQGVMMQLSYVSVGPRSARKLGGQFMNGISYMGASRTKAYVTSSISRNTGSFGSGQSGKKNTQATGATYSSPKSKPQATKNGSATANTSQTNGRKQTMKTGETKPAPKLAKPKDKEES